MKFDSIKAEIKKLALETTRIDNGEYFEAVIRSACLEEMVRALESIFGTPVWPSDDKLPKDAQALIRSVGGLRKGQTLYFLNNEGSSAFAMLWPWQDGERITIKISKI